MEHKEPKWQQDINFNNTKAPLKNILEVLKVIKKDYESKKKEFNRLRKELNGDTTV